MPEIGNWEEEKKAMGRLLQDEKKKNTTLAYQQAEAELERDDMAFRMEVGKQKLAEVQGELDAAKIQDTKNQAEITELKETAEIYLEEVTIVRNLAESKRS